jgi:rhamnulokinase
MSDRKTFLALDLGAESGRGELVTLEDGKLTMEEIHRFPNRKVPMDGTLYWDFPGLFFEILAAIAEAGRRCDDLQGMAVDTWGVDFGLLGADGQLIANPVCYRDKRTEGALDRAGKIMPIGEIWDHTALHTLPINSLYQLHAMQSTNSPALRNASKVLWTPDLVNYFLTGEAKGEKSIVQTSQLLDKSCQWCEPICRAFELPLDLFPELIEPGTQVGTLRPDLVTRVGCGDVPVIATAGHDTSAAVAAVPGQGDNWAFLSCGTWSIYGKPVATPIDSRAAWEGGYANEYTFNGWYFCQNILGLWLVQELRRTWDTPDDAWDYNRVTAEAAAAPSGPLFNAADESLLAPADMEQAILDLLESSGQATPESKGQLLRCVLESLALQYNAATDTLGELTGDRPEAIYMVGGGIKNKVLCQFTADACGIPIHAGADQCTAMGNALGQAMAMGIVKDVQEARAIMRDSFEMTTYTPQDQDAWAEKRKRYAALQQA